VLVWCLVCIFGVVKIFVSWEVEGGRGVRLKRRRFLLQGGEEEKFLLMGRLFIMKGRVSCG
jgi:hypothetical protein